VAGRSFVLPEDISASIVPVCAHRILPSMGSGPDATERVASELQALQTSIPQP
jgi:hypothetical protein